MYIYICVCVCVCVYVYVDVHNIYQPYQMAKAWRFWVDGSENWVFHRMLRWRVTGDPLWPVVLGYPTVPARLSKVEAQATLQRLLIAGRCRWGDASRGF